MESGNMHRSTSFSLVGETAPRRAGEQIVSTMKQREKAVSPMLIVFQIVKQEESQWRKKQRLNDVLSSTAFGSNACQKCGECDVAQFELSSDNSGTLCGACFKDSVGISGTREATQRSDPVATFHTQLCSNADGLENASDRRKERYNELSSTTRVRGSDDIRTAQTRLANRQIIAESKLSQSHVKKRDRVVVEIHKCFKTSGVNPDTCPLCCAATTIAHRLFVRASAHRDICQTEICFCNVLTASSKSLAVEFIMQAIARIDPQTVGGKDCLQRITAKLDVIITDYTFRTGVSNSINRRVRTILDAPPNVIGIECVHEGKPSTPASNHCTNELNLQSLHVSIKSAAQIGIATAQAAELAYAFAQSPEGYGWTALHKSWPVDVVVLMLISRFQPTFSNGHLDKQCEKHSIPRESVKKAIDLISTHPDTTSDTVAPSYGCPQLSSVWC